MAPIDATALLSQYSYKIGCSVVCFVRASLHFMFTRDGSRVLLGCSLN